MPIRSIASCTTGGPLGSRARERRGGHHQRVLAAVAAGEPGERGTVARLHLLDAERSHVLEVAERQHQAKQPLRVEIVGPGLPPWVVVGPQPRAVRPLVERQHHDRYRGRLGEAQTGALEQLAHRIRLVAHGQLGEVAGARQLLVGDLEVLHVAFDVEIADRRQEPVLLGRHQPAQQPLEPLRLALQQRRLARRDRVGGGGIDRDAADLEDRRIALRMAAGGQRQQARPGLRRERNRDANGALQSRPDRLSWRTFRARFERQPSQARSHDTRDAGDARRESLSSRRSRYRRRPRAGQGDRAAGALDRAARRHRRARRLRRPVRSARGGLRAAAAGRRDRRRRHQAAIAGAERPP